MRARKPRSSGTAAASTGATAISPPGVRAVVAPATVSATASGSTRRVATARSTARNASTVPTATHGSGRRPRSRGTNQVPNASAAIHGVPRRRPARPSRGSSSRDTRNQHSSPSSADGNRIHGVAAEISDHQWYGSENQLNGASGALSQR